MPTTIDDRVAELERKNAELARELEARIGELKEARARQAATSAVLEAISRSPADTSPVFEAIVESATRLCRAEFTAVARFEGGLLHLVAINNLSPEEKAAFHSMFPRPPLQNFAMGRAFLDGRPVQFADVLAEPDYDPRTRAVLQSVIQYRSFLGVPILREGRPIGVIGCGRREVRPVTDDEIAILQIFAGQAAIALENARLIAETQEALDQQTATAEVLQVINASPGALAPVFDAILEKAHALGGASRGTLFLFDGEVFRAAASHGYPEALREPPREIPVSEDPRLAALLAGERLIHVTDLTQLDDPIARAVAQRGGVRTNLLLPLRKDGVLLGVLSCNRSEVRPFTETQIALLQNFAAQAVIAIENARLLTETREALEQQTATAEVLQVINASPGDLAPVFAAMLEKATRLCEAPFGTLRTWDGERFHIGAVHGEPRFIDWVRQRGSFRPDHDGSPLGRIVAGEQLIQLADAEEALTTESTGDPVRHALVGLAGARSLVSIALRRDEALLGAITVYRQEVRPFTDKQIALLQNFAAQAVIAMENARLLTETREALEQQTATAEVLQVINASPGDLVPVFDAILEKAQTLCDAAYGSLGLYDGERFRAVAVNSVSEAFAERLREGFPGLGGRAAPLLQGAPFVHIHDIAEINHPMSRMAVELTGARTSLAVPLRKDKVLLGIITAVRQEVRPFSEKQIALLQNFAAQAVIAMENARLLTETREALDRQTATSEVLGIISSSPGRLEPVFDAILASAVRVCAGKTGMLALVEDGGFRGVAVHGIGSEFAATLSRLHHPPPDTGLDLLQKSLHTVQIADCTADPTYDAVRALNPGFAAVRTALHVPMIRDAELLGAIAIYRDEVRPFDDQEVDLVENFAKQAVIAIENTRLITEIREALEQQTATAEVLQVINSSPGDLAPVFDAMIRKAVPLCGAAQGSLRIFDGEALHLAAWHGDPRFVDRARELGPIVPGPGHPMEPLLRGERVVHLADAREATAKSRDLAVQERVAVANIRSWLAVALRKDGALLGTIAVSRHEVRPFSEKEITLLENFAAQAVIAMENARLLTETREALEQQTATAEVLQVINASPGDLAPVFEAMLEKATRLCEAPFGILRTWDGERFHFGAVHGDPRFCDWVRQRGPVQTDSDASLLGRIRAGERVVHITDAQNDEAFQASAGFREMAEASGVRSAITVALNKDDALLGIITVYRQEVRPFSDKQIVLLKNFAAQAVIAMENARLLTETREALEQQTATAEVLQVINSSPGDLAPVFDAILEKAHTLCGADHGSLFLQDGDIFRAIASRGMTEEMTGPLREGLRANDSPLAQPLMAGEPFVHVHDSALDKHPSWIKRALDTVSSHRTLLSIPLRKSDALLGMIVAGRFEVRAFTDHQIALLQNFAAQAVIAMENARLLTETREALEQQTATADVLQVINSSPGDLAPVFDAMLAKALGLCGAAFGVLWTYENELLHASALRGVPPAFADLLTRAPHPIGLDNAHGRLLSGESVVHVLNLEADEAYRSGDPIRRALVELGGGRVLLAVPLRKDDALLGIFTIYRQEVRPFTDKQIALLQNFAAQAVIAMENARLLTETREALEQRTATAEVLEVINSSPGDLAPVFDAMLEKAARLCGASLGTLWEYDGERMHALAMRGVSPEYAEYLSREPLRPGAGALGSFVRGETILHVLDLKDTDAYRNGDIHRRALVDLGGGRSLLGVPLRTDDRLRGAFLIYRREPQPFTDKQIALLQNFAAQAVIAMENARLLTETREALEQQTATAEVLQVINSSPGDLDPVFDAILLKAHKLCEASFGSLMIYDGERFQPVAHQGVPAPFAEFIRPGIRPEPGNPFDRMVEGAPLSHIHDLSDVAAQYPDDSLPRAAVDLGGIRTLLVVPLRKDNALIGAIIAYRQEVRPFSDKQIALLQSFAAQAVIAMENARLLTETREALQQQTATAEVLQVINSSPGDLAPVFEAMLERAMRLCDAAFGGLWTLDDDRYVAVAARGVPQAYSAFLAEATMMPGPGTAPYRFLRGERLVHNIDLASEEPYLAGDPQRRALVDLGGARTALQVPLRKDGIVLGVITIYRQQVRPFSDKQIAVLENFAGQAVIAMENARLLGELRQRTRDLEESLEYQVAVGDVLKIISRSAFDLETVLQTVVTTAVRLCRADSATIYRNVDGEYRWAAGHMLVPEYEQIERKVRIRPDPGTLVGRAVTEGRTVHILDAWTDPLYEPKRDARIGGVHTMLGLPLLREGVPIGAIGLARRRVEAFSEREVQLVTTFADQAVIAIENARLLGELRERTEELAAREAELRVTFDNMADGVAMFDAELRLAAWNRNFQELLDLPDAFVAERPRFADYFRYLAERGEYGSPELEAELSQSIADAGRELRLERTRPDGRIIEVRRNAAPGGGFVLIYSDITERKRAEEAIRAARDAAETALRDLQTAQASLIHAQKMAALGQLTAGVAHEIKNPLNFVNNFAGLSVELLDELRETTGPALASLGGDARAELDDIVETLTGNLNKIAEHGRRADGIVKSMLEHSRTGSSERRWVDINALVEEALNLAYHGARAEYQSFNITLDRDLEREIAPIEAMPQDLTRVFLNLFGNGFYAADKRRRAAPDAEFRPTLRVVTRDLGSEVEIRVRDNGTGIAPEFRDKLFQPFFTTKPTGEGTGLGLSISYDIVTQQHGGTISVDSAVGEFTEFTIRLPRRTSMMEKAG